MWQVSLSDVLPTLWKATKTRRFGGSLPKVSAPADCNWPYALWNTKILTAFFVCGDMHIGELSVADWWTHIRGWLFRDGLPDCIQWKECGQCKLSWILGGISLLYGVQPSARGHFCQLCILTYLFLGAVLLGKLTGTQLVRKFPTFYGTRRLITAFTSAHLLSLSWASSIHSIPPHPISWRSILILSSHLRLGLPSGPFPSGFPTKILHTPLLSPILATCPAHLILVDFITRTLFIEQYRSLSSSLRSFLHSPVTSSLSALNILLSTLFSNTLSLVPPTMWATKFHTHTKKKKKKKEKLQLCIS